MIPAGRGEVYAQTLSVSDSGRVTELDAPRHTPPEVIVRQAVEHVGLVRWAGGGALAHVDLIRECASREKIELLEGDAIEDLRSEHETRVWIFARAVDDYATEIVQLSLMSHAEGGTVRPEDLRALYVRASDAELKE
jgi:hypothetical protein